ncbi:Coenzyme F420 hydrogenase/dehydrogenase, beta subunit C-terminal domain [Blastopirellula marina]|uniref:Iron-sulfur cluster-binding protein/coenzyme F420-reducing hydrogenase, beta subunit, putative n=1 Tax=Blastopirellula marina DSM 3645 TaxID=314230 RepID=A4A260_9BACT|nr:coenzyme F420 hydrogenase/dehydrogenase beta subunit N-terminal domain-containing protein [Blastopirellula marina]EAQ77163.1 iron-sulfur cluster-binding protein/coenzyme F420-reducing hydrogenase, beta subunit, putative [Blastopirellula marina DSM 3645]
MSHYFLAYSKNQDIRQLSTSGGFVKEVLAHALRSGLVDKIIYPHMPSGLEPIVEITSDTEKLFSPCANSIYQDIPLTRFVRDRIQQNERYAITTLPCQSKAFLLGSQFPLVIELQCGRVPSPAWTYGILTRQNLTPQDVKRFIYRTGEWPGQGRIETLDGRILPFNFRRAWDEEVHHKPPRCCGCTLYNKSPQLVVGDPWRLLPMFSGESGMTLLRVNDPSLIPWLTEANIKMTAISHQKYQQSVKSLMRRKKRE